VLGQAADEEAATENLPVMRGPIPVWKLGELLLEQNHPELASKEFVVH